MDDELKFPQDTAVPQGPEDLEPPQTMIGRSPYGSALGNGPDPVPYKGRDALGRTEPWTGDRQEKTDPAYGADPAGWPADPPEWAGDHDLIVPAPSVSDLATVLLQRAMAADAEGMTNAIKVMTPADRDHVLASLFRAESMLKKKVMEDW